MTDKKVWFITGAGRGMGVDIAKAALAAGNAVVATGRSTDTVRAALGHDELVLAAKLDITRPRRRRGGRPGRRRPIRTHRRAGQQRWQLQRRILRGDHPGGLPGADRDHSIRPHQRHPRGASCHARPALRPGRHHHFDRWHRGPGVLHRIRRLQVRGGGLDRVDDPRGRAFRHPHDARRARFFRTELLTPQSTGYAEPSIDDYAERTEQTVAASRGRDGLQGGDPAKLAYALVQLASQAEPPKRFVAGADAIATIEQKAKDLLAQVDAHRALSSNLGHDAPDT